MTESTPLSRLAARHEWQGGNVGGVTAAPTPSAAACLYNRDPCPANAPWHCECRAWLDVWQDKMSPGLFDANGYARRVDRGTYRRRLANRLITAAGVVMWCALVVWIVWGVTT